MIAARCVSTVLTPMPRYAPIFLFVCPSAISWTTLRSLMGEGRFCSIAPRQKRLQQGFGDLVGEKRPVSGQRGNGLEQVALRIGLEQIAARAGVEDVEDQILILVPREDEDLGSWKPPAQMLGDLDPVHQRQSVLEHGNVRLRGDGFEDGLLAVGCLCGHLPIRLSFQGLSESEPNDLTVIGNEYAGHGANVQRSQRPPSKPVILLGCSDNRITPLSPIAANPEYPKFETLRDSCDPLAAGGIPVAHH